MTARTPGASLLVFLLLILFAVLIPAALPAARADATDDYNTHVAAYNAAKDAQDWATVVTATTGMINAMADMTDVTDAMTVGAYEGRAVAEEHLKDWEAASRDLAVALSRKTDDCELWGDAGTAASGLGRYADAVTDYTKAIALSPPAEDVGTLTRCRGAAYEDNHQYAEAIADYTTCLDRGGSDADTIRYFRARAYTESVPPGDKTNPAWQKALEDANFLIAGKTVAGYVVTLRGDIYTGRGEDAKALADYGFVVDHDTGAGKVAALKKRVDFYLSREDYPHAIADDTAAIAIAPTDELYDQRAAIHYNAKQYADAVTDYRESQKLYPSPFTLGNLLDALIANADYPGALTLCDEQIALDPKPEANLWYARRGRLRFHQADWAGTADDFTAEIQNEQYMSQNVPNTSWAEAYAYRARALAGKGDIDAATSDIAAAVKIAPDAVPVLFASADVARVNKDYPAALAALNQILAKNDKDSDALYLRAQVLLAQGDVTKAKSDDIAARALDPNLPALTFPVSTPPAAKTPAKSAVKTPVKLLPAKRKVRP